MYLVTAYRWGWLNGGQYPVYCGPDRTKALALAELEPYNRGGKYGCAVDEWTGDGTESARIAYFCSGYGEKEPSHNWRINYFERMGHAFDDYAEGRMWVPTGDENRTLKSTTVPLPPDFVLAEVKRQRDFRDMMIRMQNERSANPTDERRTRSSSGSSRTAD